MVQLRDVETWKMLPGVKSGDLGPKIGYVSKDNGWAAFDHVRIPRTNMLMGLCEVNKEGEFSIIGDPRILYSVMSGIRMLIVQSMGIRTVEASKMALRYCTVRRQFATVKGTRVERQVIDYQTTYTKLSRTLCRGLVTTVAGMWVNKNFELMMKDV